MQRNAFNRAASLVIVIGASLTMSATSHAALLGLMLQDHPDIFSGFLDVTYNATTHQFNAQGFALTYDDDGSVPPEVITNGMFNLNATVNNAGVATGGSLMISGNVLGFGPSLLTGSLLDFGAQDGAGATLFEFLFSVTGGDLAGHYGGMGALFGVILNMNAQGHNGFGSNFDNLLFGQPGTGAGVSDTASIPGPSVLMTLLAGGWLAFPRRRRAR